ncbi:hypothetical protein Pla22_17400 [Rubripirellula amarantea]|uniref:Uncharacterized protein n=1 Tax=Rubripirellula amarantea TaxID=2527999 RepID=A0A5C5WVZ1_9BACT|nr:hypothetical protein [Rubripirellula amarantea]TWT54105.1 hypothetical protein Pla22_17400 [Rubripirellula amarantea]
MPQNIDYQLNAPVQAKPKRRTVSILIGLSFLFTACMLAWAFSIPFRASSANVSSVHSKNSERVLMTPEEVVGYQAEVKERHQMFLQDLRKRTSKVQPLPAKSEPEVEAHWETRRKHLEAEISIIDEEIRNHDSDDGSVPWKDREYLMKVLEDA